MGAIRSSARAAAARALQNRRTVLLTYPGLRLGNVLYLALHAYTRQSTGEDYKVVDPVAGSWWNDAFPALRPLLVEPGEVRRTDARDHIPSTFLQDFGVDFSRADLETFSRRVLLPIAGPPQEPADGLLVVNVRRGDYYEVEKFQRLFGFDVATYVREAVGQVETASGPAATVHVVSDGPAWCREHLAFLGTGGRQVTYSSPADGPLKNLCDVVAARRLIITNSTFSYWAAYLSNVNHRDNHALVWAPDFHSRAVDGGQPWQHDPLWRTVPVTESQLRPPGR